MFYAVVLFTTAFLIAGVAAYFSVYGLAHIFAGSFTAAVIMGSVLEMGKLVATSFLYRSWSIIGWWLRAYILIAIVGLMVLTSAGIFGYLSNAYQQDTNDLKIVETRVDLIDSELVSLTTREQQINADIARVGDNFVSARQNLMKQYNEEQRTIRTRVAELRLEQLELKTKLIEVEAHTGPIIYIAKALDRGVDDAVMWVILLVIVVFDPLAIALTIGANIVWVNNQKEQVPSPPSQDVIAPTTTNHEVDAIKPSEGVTAEDVRQPTPDHKSIGLEDVLREKMDMISAILEEDEARQAQLDELDAPKSKRLIGALYPTPEDVERVKTYKAPTVKH